jgi:hypothetical protein
MRKDFAPLDLALYGLPHKGIRIAALHSGKMGERGLEFGLKVNTVHFGGADHRTLWSAAFGDRWQATQNDRLPHRNITK